MCQSNISQVESNPCTNNENKSEDNFANNSSFFSGAYSVESCSVQILNGQWKVIIETIKTMQLSSPSTICAY